ncbi:MAG: 30S ribosomal protein S17 [Candidatus Altiarchaeota archaeon]|nr:30S ribosomal protein S17 [Candidatus Altiarchaeota archaeon]
MESSSVKVGHGISVRGQTFTGRVVKAKSPTSVVVEWDRIIKVQKYDRVYKTTSKLLVHVPKGLRVRTGDAVKIGETRRLSRAKSFVILEVLSDGKKN